MFTKNSSPEYYQNNKERLHTKKALERNQSIDNDEKENKQYHFCCSFVTNFSFSFLKLIISVACSQKVENKREKKREKTLY